MSNLLHKVDFLNKTMIGWLFHQESKFKIPFFQREYAWGKEQLTTLFWDIVECEQKNSENQNNEHIMGIVHINSKKDKGEIRVIDGQQRITTFFILTKVFKDVISKTDPNPKEKDEYFESLENISEEKFSSYINDDDKIIEFLKKPKINEKSKKIFEKNYYILRNLLESETKKDFSRLKRLWKTLKNHFKIGILQWEIENSKNELEIFQNLNSKSKPLSVHENIKVFLINKLENKVLDKEKIIRELEVFFKKHFGNITKFTYFYEDFLLFYKTKRDYKSSGSEKISGQTFNKFKKIFIDKGKKCSEWNYDEFKSEVKYLSSFLRFDKLLSGKRINGPRFDKLRIAKDNNLQTEYAITNSMRPLIYYLFDLYFVCGDPTSQPAEFIQKIKNPKSFKKILEILEIYRMRNQAFTNNDSLKPFFTKLIKEIEKNKELVGEKHFESIPKIIWKYLSCKDLDHGFHIVDDKSFQEKLMKQPLQKSYVPLFFHRLDEYFANHGNNNSNINNVSIINNKSIEHIAPKSGNNGWKSYLESKNDESYNDKIELIGNLIMVPKPDNSLYSDKNFTAKKVEYKNNLKGTKIYHISGTNPEWNKNNPTRKLTSVLIKDFWRSNQIDTRTKELANIFAYIIFKDPEF